MTSIAALYWDCVIGVGRSLGSRASLADLGSTGTGYSLVLLPEHGSPETPAGSGSMNTYDQIEESIHLIFWRYQPKPGRNQGWACGAA